MEAIYHADSVYLSQLEAVLARGVRTLDRTGVGTLSLFELQGRYDLRAGFPLLTSKKVFTRGVFEELVFFLQGRTDNKWLQERGVHIWDEWAGSDTSGDLGPIYGYQWRNFGASYVPQAARDRGQKVVGGVDQVLEVLQALKTQPYSRRHLISAWNPPQLAAMALPPCHTLLQFKVLPGEDGVTPTWLSSSLKQRSGDMFLGVPFNIASYAALTQLFAALTGLKPLEFVHNVGDAHIYLNHQEQVKEQLSRAASLPPMPSLSLNLPVPPEEVDLTDPKIFDTYGTEVFQVENYHPLPAIKAPVAV